MNIKTYLKCYVLSFGALVSTYAQQPNENRVSYSTFDLPNNQRLMYATVLKTVEKSALFPEGMVLFNQLILQTNGIGGNVVYQTPSSPFTDFGVMTKRTKELPFEAMIESDRMEVLLQAPNSGWFTSIRLRSKNGEWNPTGLVEDADFDYTTRFAEVSCTGSKLIDWGTVQLNMSNDSKRILNIDEEGVIRENGIVHEYERVVRVKNISQEQNYKDRQRRALSFYFEPRDVNGVPISLINAIKIERGIVDAPKAGTPSLNAVIAPAKIQEKPSKGNVNTLRSASTKK